MTIFVYMNFVLFLQNGLYSALPYIVFWAMITFGGWLADFLAKTCFSITITRKAVNTFGKSCYCIETNGSGQELYHPNPLWSFSNFKMTK